MIFDQAMVTTAGFVRHDREGNGHATSASVVQNGWEVRGTVVSALWTVATVCFIGCDQRLHFI